MVLLYERTNEYERFIGLQTLVRTSFYQFCIFLPVYICTEISQMFFCMVCDTFQPSSALLFNSFHCAPTNMCGSSVCKHLSGLPSTTFMLLYLFRLTEVR
ncbi:hypothetical protein T07_10452 [Trichinella nelsoni]|uniref:Uncharacterized protein n=1 Tax=Trichinella nelsoni TaxID=6336 RepID=A0A0V0RCM3_9BILA|nr:hypothetical protein T07_10452 [Trichinella nelsoni]